LFIQAVSQFCEAADNANMNIFFLSMSMSPKEAAKWHANIHVVKMIVETAQLLCNVHQRARELCVPPYTQKRRIPYKDSAAGHRKLGSMIWIGESLGNYRWGVALGLALCKEYNNGRGRAAGKTTRHKTQKVLEWLRDHEPIFKKKNRGAVKLKHCAMPDKLKKAVSEKRLSAVEAYREYYYSKRHSMVMAWPEGRAPPWWVARQSPKSKAKDQKILVELMHAKRKLKDAKNKHKRVALKRKAEGY